MAGNGRHLAAAPARTVGAARSVAVPARQAGARLETVPVRLGGARRDAAPVRRPLMARAGIPRKTRAAGGRQPSRATGPVGRHARPPETHRRHARPPETHRGGTAGRLRASTAAAPGPQMTAGSVLLRMVRPAKAPVAAPQWAAGLAVRQKEASVATLRRIATSVAPGSQPTLGHGGLPRGTQGEARDPRATPRGLRPVLMRGLRPVLRGAGEIRIARVHGLRAKGRPLVMTVVTGHRDQPAAGPATPAQVTRARVTRAQPVAGQAPGAGTRHGPAAGVRTRPQRAVTRPPTWPGRRFLIRSTPSSSSRKRVPS